MKSVITCDLEGVIETINPDGEKLFGYPKEELIGKKRVSLFSAGEIVIQNVGTWLKGATKDGEHTTKTFFISQHGSLVSCAGSWRNIRFCSMVGFYSCSYTLWNEFQHMLLK